MLKGFAFKKFGMISRVCLQILNLSLGFGGQSRRDIFPVTSLIHWLLKNYPVASCGGINPQKLKIPAQAVPAAAETRTSRCSARAPSDNFLIFTQSLPERALKLAPLKENR